MKLAAGILHFGLAIIIFVVTVPASARVGAANSQED
jgi:hypothetical protein